MTAPLRLVIVGHVDHGKSTLVGRLLHDTDSLPQGKLEAIQASCRKRGVGFEFAFLMDALQSERDQNITIDTAQICFQTAKRSYVIIDAPGHKEFLKNMVTGASQADAALLLIAANEGVQEQSRRHGTLLSLLGIRQIVVLVNKMDLCGYDQAIFESIQKEYRAFLGGLDIQPMAFLPLSAREGDNLVRSSPRLKWFQGPCLLEALDHFAVSPPPLDKPLRFVIQDVYRFDPRRILAGRVESGSLQPGDTLYFYPGGKSSKVASIERWAAPESAFAQAGESIGITLNEQIFVERGCIATHWESPLIQAHELRARIFWLGKQPLEMGKRYRIKLATQEAECHLKEVRYAVDSSTLEVVKEARRIVDRNEVAEVVLVMRTPLAFDNQEFCTATGRFVLVDELELAGGGIIFGHAYTAPELISTNISYNPGLVQKEERARLKGHLGAVLWFTGLSGSGKSTLANAIEKELTARGIHCFELDGDNLRFGLNRDLGFSEEDRRENIRRSAEVARILAQSCTVALVSLISPFRQDRSQARAIARQTGIPFFEVFLDAPLSVCEQRDPKGLYAKARRDEIAHFTGVSSPYEAPESPDLHLRTDQLSLEQCSSRVLDLLMPAIRLKA